MNIEPGLHHLLVDDMDLWYQIRINPNRKRVGIFILPDSSTEVRVPPHIQKKDIEKYLISMGAWIKETQMQVIQDSNAKLHAEPIIPYDTSLPYNVLFGLHGKPITYTIIQNPRRKTIALTESQGIIQALVPTDYHLREVQDFIVENTRWIIDTITYTKKNIRNEKEEIDTIEIPGGKSLQYWIFRIDLLDVFRFILTKEGTCIVFAPHFSTRTEIREFVQANVSQYESLLPLGTKTGQTSHTDISSSQIHPCTDTTRPLNTDSTYSIIRVKGREHISLILQNSGKIQVRTPKKYHSRDIQAFIKKQREWIVQSRTYLNESYKTKPELLANPDAPYRILCMVQGIPLPYSILTSAKKKIFSLQIHPDTRLIVNTPVTYDIERIEKFIHLKYDWIRKKQSYFETIPVVPERTYCQGETFHYLGTEYLLHSEKTGFNAGVVIQGNQLIVRIPQEIPSDMNDLSVKQFLLTWYQEQAEKTLPDLVKLYTKKLQLSMPALRYNLVTRKWGSYNIKKHEIMCNISLMMAPIRLIEYVAAHEVCHIIHHNHSKAFWYELKGIMPDYQERKEELRRWQYSYHL